MGKLPCQRLDTPGRTDLAIAIARLSDGLLYDFGTISFVESPSQLTAALPELPSPQKGIYYLDVPISADVFTDDEYRVNYYYTSDLTTPVGIGSATVIDGDYAPNRVKLVPKGLDDIDTTEPDDSGDGVAAWNFRQMVRWIFMRLWKVKRGAGGIVTEKLDGSVATTQPYSATDTTENLNAS